MTITKIAQLPLLSKIFPVFLSIAILFINSFSVFKKAFFIAFSAFSGKFSFEKIILCNVSRKKSAHFDPP